jgi:hypothetical protein
MDTRQVQPVSTIELPVDPVRQLVATNNGDFAGKETAYKITSECDAGVSR